MIFAKRRVIPMANGQYIINLFRNQQSNFLQNIMHPLKFKRELLRPR